MVLETAGAGVVGCETVATGCEYEADDCEYEADGCEYEAAGCVSIALMAAVETPSCLR